MDANTFVVKTNAASKLGDRVFVYGKYCPDLKSVDYDAISMLNVSATQELARKVEALEKENAKFQDDADRLTSIEREENQR